MTYKDPVGDSEIFGLLGIVVSTYRYDGDNEHHFKLEKRTEPDQNTKIGISYLLETNPKYPH